MHTEDENMLMFSLNELDELFEDGEKQEETGNADPVDRQQAEMEIDPKFRADTLSKPQEIMVSPRDWKTLERRGALSLRNVPLRGRQLSVGETVTVLGEQVGEAANAYIVATSQGKGYYDQPTLNIEMTMKWVPWLTAEDCFCGGLLT